MPHDTALAELASKSRLRMLHENEYDLLYEVTRLRARFAARRQAAKAGILLSASFSFRFAFSRF